MAHYDCTCCGEPLGISHAVCPECQSGRCARSETSQEAVMQSDIVQEARLDAKAFRENAVYTSDGQRVKLGANADRLDAYADHMGAQAAEITRLTEALRAAEEREKALREALRIIAACDLNGADSDAVVVLASAFIKIATQALAGAKP